jgi:hypothetical protein
MSTRTRTGTRTETRKVEVIPTSSFHSYAAAIFDLFGRIEFEHDRGYNFTVLELCISGPTKKYLAELRRIYGGRVEQDEWIIWGHEAEAFANLTRHFAVARRGQLWLFLRAFWSSQRELTNAEERKRIQIIRELKAASSSPPTEFSLPNAFFRKRPKRLTVKEQRAQATEEKPTRPRKTNPKKKVRPR